MKITEEFENKIKNSEEIEIEYIDSKKLLRAEISKTDYSISNISSSLGLNNYLYEILDINNKKKYSRDCIISILVYIKTNIDTTQRILQGFGHSKLYVRVPRDKIIFEGMCRKLDLWDIDNNLVESGFEPLFK